MICRLAPIFLLSFPFLKSLTKASLTNANINPPFFSLNEHVLEKFPELLLIERRSELSWNDPEFLAYAVGSLLSEHVEFGLLPSDGNSGEESFIAVVNGEKVMRALRNFEQSTREKLQRHKKIDFFAYESRITALCKFIIEHVRLDFNPTGDDQQIYIPCSHLFASFFFSKQAYISITIGVAFLKALTVFPEEPDLKLIANMIASLRVIFGLLHLPALAPLIRPHVYKIVCTINRHRDLTKGLPGDKRIFLYSLSSTLPEDDPIMQSLIIENINSLLDQTFLERDFRIFEPLLCDTLKTKLIKLAESQGVDLITEPNAISRAFFFPILITCGLAGIHHVQGFTFFPGHLATATRVDGKLAEPFTASHLIPAFKIPIVSASMITPQQLLAREEMVLFYHELPLHPEFKEQVRLWIDGEKNVATPMFIYTLYAAGVTLFTSKAVVFQNN